MPKPKLTAHAQTDGPELSDFNVVCSLFPLVTV